MTRTKRTALALLTVFISSPSDFIDFGLGDATARTSRRRPDKPPLTAQELEGRLIAPWPLTPTRRCFLVFRSLDLSPYCMEIVQANRWLKANHALKADVMATELEKQTWDASVKSLVNFPDVLGMMSDKLDLTVKLGDAFIDQQADVMNTVQVLRGKAQASGNLKTNDQQKSPSLRPGTMPPCRGDAASGHRAGSAPTNHHDPIRQPDGHPTCPLTIQRCVYGACAPIPPIPPIPTIRPVRPATSPRRRFPSASASPAVRPGAMPGATTGNWGRGDININVNQNANFNNNINRNVNNGNINTGNINRGNGNGSWQHNPAHRQGVPYDNKAARSEIWRCQLRLDHANPRGLSRTRPIPAPWIRPAGRGKAGPVPETRVPPPIAPTPANPGGCCSANRPQHR